MKNLTLKSIRLIFGNAKVVMLLCFAVLFFGMNSFAQSPQIFSYSGAVQTFVVPDCITEIEVKIWGAGGGNGANSSAGGSGAFVKGLISVTPGQTLKIIVGQGGAKADGGAGSTPSGGSFGGGGRGTSYGGAGGGYSGIFNNAVSSSNAIAIAGGGGGGIANSSSGTGGGNSAPGASLQGSNGNGGGGGGYQGGALSKGGSSFTTGISSLVHLLGNTSTNPANRTPAPGNSESEYTNGTGIGGQRSGQNGGNGLVIISWVDCVVGPPAEFIIGSLTSTPSPLCFGEAGLVKIQVTNKLGSNIASGVNTYSIDYSLNNTTWTNFGAVNDILNNATKDFSFTFTPNSMGTVTIYIRVKDSGGNYITKTLSVSVVDCTVPPAGDPNCANAPYIQTLGLHQGNTGDFPTVPSGGHWLDGSGPGTTIENIGYYKFTANSTTLSFVACAGVCSYKGIQFYLFKTCGVKTSKVITLGQMCNGCGSLSRLTNGTGYTSSVTNSGGGCYTFTVGGLTIGDTYYWGVDGYDGSNCNYSIQFTSGISTLPIELTSFTGKPTPQGNLIQWETASERINDYFELESTIDGINFNTIAKIAGAGSKSTVSNYEFLDKNPAGQINYYRLRQVDYDGESETFEVISVEREARNEIFISPNPVIHNLRVELDVETSTSYTFNLISMSGMQTISNYYLEKGYNNIELNMSQLSKGFYMLQVSDAKGNTLTTKKVIKN